MIPLPNLSYEIASWAKTGVQPDHHIKFDQNVYSVLYDCIKCAVDVRVTRYIIEAFIFKMDNKLIGTIIVETIKVAGKIISSGRYLIFKLSSIVSIKWNFSKRSEGYKPFPSLANPDLKKPVPKVS